MFANAASAIDNKKEPTIELCVIVEGMREAIKIDRSGSDPEFSKFLHEELGPGLAKRLYKERSNDPKVSSYYANSKFLQFNSFSI